MYLVPDTVEEPIPAKFYKPFEHGWKRELRISTNPHYSVTVSYISPNGLKFDDTSDLDKLSPYLRWDDFLFEPRSISMSPYENLVFEQNSDKNQHSADNNQHPVKSINTNKPLGLSKFCDTASSRLIMRRKMFSAESAVNGGNLVNSPSVSINNLRKRPSESCLDEACPRKKMVVIPTHSPVQPLQMDNMEIPSFLKLPDEVTKFFPERPKRRPAVLQRSKPRLISETLRLQKVASKTQNILNSCRDQQLMNPSSRTQPNAKQCQIDSLDIDANSVWAVREPVDEAWRKLDGPIVLSGNELKRLVEGTLRGLPLEHNSVEVTVASLNVNMPSQFPRPCSTHCALFSHEPYSIRTPGKVCISCGLLYHSKCAVHWWQQLSLKNSVILYSEKWKQVKRKHCPTCFTKLAENIMKDVLHGVAKRDVASTVSLTFENPFSESLKAFLPDGKFWLVASTRLFPPEVVGIGDFRLSDKLAIEYQVYRIRLPYLPMFDMIRNPQPLVVVHGERVFNLSSRDVLYEKDVVSIKLNGVIRICSRRQQVVIFPPTVEVPVSVTPSPSVATTDFLQIPTVDPVSDEEKADDNDADCQVISDDTHCQVISDDEPDNDVIEIEVDEAVEECIEIPMVVEEHKEASHGEAENGEEFASSLETDDVDTKDTETLQLIRSLDQKRRTSGETQMKPSDAERRVGHSKESEVNHDPVDALSNDSQNSVDVKPNLNSPVIDSEDALKSEDDDVSTVNIDGEIDDRQGKGNSESDFELYTYPNAPTAELVISDEDESEGLSSESESMDVESVGIDCEPSEGTGEGVELPEDMVTSESSTPPLADGLQCQSPEEDVKPVKRKISAVMRRVCINDLVNHQIFDSIFVLLDTPSLLRCRIVCRQWKRIIDSSPKLCGGRYHARPGYSLRLYDESALLLWLLQKEVSSVDLRNLIVSSSVVVDNMLKKLQELISSFPCRFYLKELTVKSCSRDVLESSRCVLSKLQLICENIVESQTEDPVDSKIGDCQDSQQT